MEISRALRETLNKTDLIEVFDASGSTSFKKGKETVFFGWWSLLKIDGETVKNNDGPLKTIGGGQTKPNFNQPRGYVSQPDQWEIFIASKLAKWKRKILSLRRLQNHAHDRIDYFRFWKGSIFLGEFKFIKTPFLKLIQNLCLRQKNNFVYCQPLNHLVGFPGTDSSTPNINTYTRNS